MSGDFYMTRPFWGDRNETVQYGQAFVAPDNRTWRVGEQVWPQPIPEGAMRVAPGSDAVVWRTNPDYSGEL